MKGRSDVRLWLEVPGWTVALSILAIPLTMALAVRRQARWDETLVNTHRRWLSQRKIAPFGSVIRGEER